jgi:hypothetical protein
MRRIGMGSPKTWQTLDLKKGRSFRFYRRFDSPYELPDPPYEYWIQWEDTFLEPTIVKADKMGLNDEGIWLFYLNGDLVECAAEGAVTQIVNATVVAIMDISEGECPPV